jgi:hypothetical protein
LIYPALIGWKLTVRAAIPIATKEANANIPKLTSCGMQNLSTNGSSDTKSRGLKLQ